MRIQIIPGSKINKTTKERAKISVKAPVKSLEVTVNERARTKKRKTKEKMTNPDEAAKL